MNNPNVYRGSIDCFLSAVCKLHVDYYMTARDTLGRDVLGKGDTNDGTRMRRDTRRMGSSRDGTLEGWDTRRTGYSRDRILEGQGSLGIGHPGDGTLEGLELELDSTGTACTRDSKRGVGHLKEWICEEYVIDVGNVSGCKRKSSFNGVEEDIPVLLLGMGTEDRFHWVRKKWKLFQNLCLFLDSGKIILFCRHRFVRKDSFHYTKDGCQHGAEW